MPYNFTTIEKKWQDYWLANRTFAALEPHEADGMPKAYILDMFPYPSGTGLHVGHPEGYTATDIVSRYLRMKGVNVLHPMGWDAFGLPAEQYAIKTGQHPRKTTEENINNFRRQIQMLGLSYDWEREVDTTDPKYYRWTQWIFLQLFNSYFDPAEQKAMPIAHLVNELENENYVVGPDGSIHENPTAEGTERILGEIRIERLWRELSQEERVDVIARQRLAYIDEVPVNWCPGLGTVLSNEEVIDGRSERGNFPVERRPMRQWLLRITAYAERLLDDLDQLTWPESLKTMQREWIGQSLGADVDFEIANPDGSPPTGDDGETITVFTTRPDTLYGATYMVMAPEHELVDKITTSTQRKQVDEYRTATASKSERDRAAGAKDKTGVFTGAYAINPVNQEKIPVYIADYVLTGYGTGAIMAVPAHDDRDFEFAQKFNLPMRWVVAKADGKEPPHDHPFVEDGIAINSPVIDGLPTPQAKEKMIEYLEAEGSGTGSIKYKLRDWLFSRQRYWGEPFPILLNDNGDAFPVPESQLPIELPPMTDFQPPKDSDAPKPPLSKVTDWVRVQNNDGVFYRETNTMPQWAGSCWYYLRYIDPKNEKCFVDPAKERYWMPVDLYVGGAEHAVLHLLYARFWHKVLYDLGHVSSVEPFKRLVNQGLILGEMEYHAFSGAGGDVSAAEVRDLAEESDGDESILIAIHRKTGEKLRGRRVVEAEIEKTGDGYRLRSNPQIKVDARSFKMAKSRGNVVNPDKIVEDYGTDTFRLYEMYMGPLEAVKPWATRDIVGMSRFLNSIWRNFVGEGDDVVGAPRVKDEPIPEALDRQMHRTIKKVGEDVEALRFNTAIAELIKLNNELTALPSVPRMLAENFVLMLAPFAPHLAEELWLRLGHHKTLARRPWPTYEEAKLFESTIEIPVQVNGKLRDRITVPANADEALVLHAAAAAEKAKPWIDGKTIVKKLYVPNKLVNFVVKD